jgi:histidyl-tRNA synthetase
MHARQSYKTTRNIGKLLGDAAKCRARHAVILDERLADGVVTVKDLDGGTQREVALGEVVAQLRPARA